jgi:hypothetical protein
MPQSGAPHVDLIAFAAPRSVWQAAAYRLDSGGNCRTTFIAAQGYSSRRVPAVIVTAPLAAVRFDVEASLIVLV